MKSRTVLFLRSGVDSNSDSYSNIATEAGFDVFSFSPIRFEFSVELLRVELQTRVKFYSGIVFTSPRAVQAFESVLTSTNFVPSNYSFPVFVVGPATGSAARALGFRSVSGDDSGDAVRLAPIIANYFDRKSRDEPEVELLFPGASKMIGGLEQLLVPEKIKLKIIPVYKTLPRDRHELEKCLEKIDSLDSVVYFSPSGVESIHQLIIDKWPQVQIVTIGKTTAAALTRSNPIFVSKSPSPQGILECLLQHFEK